MIKLLKIEKLKAHEKTNKQNLLRVKKKILAAAYFSRPIVVDKKTLVILDGHHRTKILKQIGCGKIPAYLVNYQNPKIRLSSRRPNFKITKTAIIKNALAGKLFPYKTSKHLLPQRPKNLKIKLEKLI